MKITVALVSASVGLSILGERGPTIRKRAVENNSTTRAGFLAPEAAFIFKVDSDGLSDATNRPHVK